MKKNILKLLFLSAFILACLINIHLNMNSSQIDASLGGIEAKAEAYCEEAGGSSFWCCDGGDGCDCGGATVLDTTKQ